MSLSGYIGYLTYFPIYRGVGLVYYLLANFIQNDFKMRNQSNSGKLGHLLQSPSFTLTLTSIPATIRA